MSQNRRDLKFLGVGLAVCSVHVLRLVQSSLLCWLWARSTYSSVFDRAVQWQPLRRARVISVADCFCLQKRKRDVLNGPEAVICCWQTDAVLSGEALSCHCGLTAGFHPLVLQSLFTMQVALKFNSCSSTLHGHRSLVEAQNRDSPPALLSVNRMVIHFLDHY